MELSKEQKELYRRTMEEAKKQLEEIDDKMGREIQVIREKLARLQESKKSYLKIYKATAQLLGIRLEGEDYQDQPEA